MTAIKTSNIINKTGLKTAEDSGLANTISQ
jgi:hypothetical protein